MRNMKVHNTKIMLFVPLLMIVALLLLTITHGPLTQAPQSNSPEPHYAIAQPQTTSTVNQSQNNSGFYIIITSTFADQHQQLSLPFNASGYLMYPQFRFQFFSDVGNTTYQIFFNGGLITQGAFVFHLSYTYSTTATEANISIVLTSKNKVEVFNWHNIPILHTSLGQFFKGKAGELPIYTSLQYITYGIKMALASLFVLLGVYYIVYKTYIKKKSLEIQEV